MFLSAKRRLIATCGLTVRNDQCEHPAPVRQIYGAVSGLQVHWSPKRGNEHVHDDT